MKPILKYRGGKSREIPVIMRYLPSFEGRYIEPFFGGGALFFALEPRRAIISDINDKLMAFYIGVRDNYPELIKELSQIERIYAENRRQFDRLKALHPEERVEDKNEELYYRIRDMFNGKSTNKYSEAVLYYFINKTAYSGMIRYNANGEFNVPFGRYKSLNISSVTMAHSTLLNRAEVLTCDYHIVFEKSLPSDFIFLDPPYDCVFSDYGNVEYRDTGFNEEEHRRLAEDFRNLSCPALMVIGKTSLTNELYAPFIVEEYDKNYAVNIRNRFKAAAKHIVVANYDVKRQRHYPASRKYNSRLTIEAVQLSVFETNIEYGSNRK